MSSTNDTSNPSLSPPSSDEPASQWARSTLSALEPTSTDTTTQPATVSSKSYPYSTEKIASGVQAPLTESPGSQVPGAFPGAQAETKGVEEDGQTVKRAMMDALETAKGYAYNAGGAAKDYAQSAGQAVGQYVSPSVAAYWRNLSK
ncbi:hypothetical protein NLJ89_g11291 [Agrocybe chaxingu]|uniref:Uncharacterized protein n=1 Tax=Agrocybe chaxingu TaxID=84603 RepID=A0A9W8MRA6_9AGAR|nr:hypothetical protein NLJ89_g11291 [Agrocybe chaxingu]